MEQNKCKKCQRILPNGYKHKYCENCRNEQVKHLSNIGKSALGVLAMVGGTVLAIATSGKINPTKK